MYVFLLMINISDFLKLSKCLMSVYRCVLNDKIVDIKKYICSKLPKKQIKGIN